MWAGLPRWCRDQAQRWTKMPRQLRPTRAGWMFLFIVLGVGFAALNTGNNLLYLVLSLLLAFLVLSGVLSESALRGIEVRRTPARELFAEAENPTLIEIHNNQRRVPAFALVVEDRGVVSSPALVEEPAEDRPRKEAPAARKSNDSTLRPPSEPDRPSARSTATLGRVFALRVAPGDTEARTYSLCPQQRGGLEFHSVRVSTRFPFGLFLKSRTIDAKQHVLVYPAINRIVPQNSAGSKKESAETLQSSPGLGSEVVGLRQFNRGDSLRRIHWRSSLRRGDTLVRELEDESSAEIEVRLRTNGYAMTEPPNTPSPAPFELRVSWAASEVVAHLEAGLRVGLVTDHERIPALAGPRQRTQLLRFLSLVRCGDAEIPAAARIREARVS